MPWKASSLRLCHGGGVTLADVYNTASHKDNAEVQLQLHQLCGHLHLNGLRYGALYTDQAFWFAEYDTASVKSILKVSPGILSTQASPITVVEALLYISNLAVEKRPHVRVPRWNVLKWASLALGKGYASSTQGPAAILGDCGGSSMAVERAVELRGMLGYGSTGLVYEGMVPGHDELASIKVADNDEAAERLMHECRVYEQLAPLQGTAIPAVLASGQLKPSESRGAVEEGPLLPFLAMPLHGPSLAGEPEEQLQSIDEEAILGGLCSIHALGVLHNDVRGENILLGRPAPASSGCMSPPQQQQPLRQRPVWVDFSHATMGSPNSSSRAEEERVCRLLLKARRAPRQSRGALLGGGMPTTQATAMPKLMPPPRSVPCTLHRCSAPRQLMRYSTTSSAAALVRPGTCERGAGCGGGGGGCMHVLA